MLGTIVTVPETQSTYLEHIITCGGVLSGKKGKVPKTPKGEVTKRAEGEESPGTEASGAAAAEEKCLTAVSSSPVITEEAAFIRIIQITDVYTLVNFPSFKTLVNEKKQEAEALGGKVITMLTGDFLAPYLLSSLDRGVGMMNMLNQTPIDYVIWGNHEHDLAHEHVLKREKEYKGVWINTNMQSHESFKDSKCQVDSAIIDIASKDGSNTRKLGMMGILTNTASMYKPGAFGGAVIEDPWESMGTYNQKLKDAGCDMVLPLCHLYEDQDERTCREFDFPVIMSGHDHHVVDKVVEGTRLLKPGMDAKKAMIVDLTWDTAASDSVPNISVDCADVVGYKPCPELQAVVTRAYSVLDPLLKTELAEVPASYNPLSSMGPREGRCTMATYLCTQLKNALNMDSANVGAHCDCFLLKGGNIRGERHYNSNKFSLETLRSEMQEEEDVYVFTLPGRVIRNGLKESWTGPNPGWMQYDDGVEVDENGVVVKIGRMPIDPKRMYRVGSFVDLNTDYGTPSLFKYFQENPESTPDADVGMGCHVLLMMLFSKDIWNKIWSYVDQDGDGKITREELKALDTDGDGAVCREELRAAIQKVTGLSACDGVNALIDLVLEAGGDADGDGMLTLDEINAAA